MSVRVFAALAAAVATLVAAPAEAQSRRALVVGINSYRPSESAVAVASNEGRGRWTNLEGSVNDARAVAEVLRARYRFDHVELLLDGQATRQGILDAFEREIVNAERGAVRVFYYAGHGSQMLNSLSPEPDRRDETLVPADSVKGAVDIRDKELAKLMARAAERGVRLTVILDSCHSGSMSRGISRFTAKRSMDPDLARDAKDPERGPPVTEKGVLTLTAAQDYQTAAEGRDEQNVPHGLFTTSLLSVLRTVPLDEPAESVFARVRALMKVHGGVQEPTFDGNAERAAAPLFGPPVRGARGMPIAVVRRVDGEEIRLQGGSALGLAPGAILLRESPPARLKVVEVVDLGESTARVEVKDGEKAPAVKAGDAFELERWAVRPGDAVRVYLGPALPYAKLLDAVRALSALRGSASVEWVDDPTTTAPTHTVFWAQEEWRLLAPEGEVALGVAPSARAVERAVRRSAQKAKVFVRLPPSEELVKALTLGTLETDPVRRMGREADALYLLTGRAVGARAAARIEYAWVLARPPERSGAPASIPLPARTRWLPGEPGAARDTGGELEDRARRIGRVRAWLALETAPEMNDFPYRLVLKKDDRVAIRRGETVKKGDVLRFWLQADPARLRQSGTAFRHVYVIGIDADARITVLYPADRVGLENRHPVVPPEAGTDWVAPAEIRLGDERTGIRVAPPFGEDVYVLLTSREPLPTVRQLEQEGVGEGVPRGAASAIDLLFGLGRTRGNASLVSGVEDWSVDRFPVTSVP